MADFALPELLMPGFWMMMGMGMLGMVAHWLKRWAYGQTEESLAVFFAGNKRNMLGSLLTVVGLLVGMVAVGINDFSSVHMWTAFLAGYNLNSVVANAPKQKA